MSTSETVRRRVLRFARGRAFTFEAVRACGPEGAVRAALARLVRRGVLVRVARGVYARPRSTRWGVVGPEPEEVARVIARRTGERLGVHGALAANRFGLTTQVPVQVVFYTSGRSRAVRVGKSVVRFTHAPGWCLKLAGSPAGAAVAALHHLGRERVTPEVAGRVLARLELPERERLLRPAPALPGWLRSAIEDGAKGTSAVSVSRSWRDVRAEAVDEGRVDEAAVERRRERLLSAAREQPEHTETT